jgi:uncharacterized protein (TIGR03085 family)
MTRYAFAERLALATEMAKAGPDAPTLCGDWTVRDLLAHLLLRERRPDAAGGIVLKRLAGRTARVQQAIAAHDFATMLDRLRNPPWWSPIANPLVDEVANLSEMFIHHEDVRRAAPTWIPRALTSGVTEALWRQAGTRAKLALRRYPADIRVLAPGTGEVSVGAGGPDVISLTGTPGELLMYLSGRPDHAQVTLDGPADATQRFRRVRLGI